MYSQLIARADETLAVNGRLRVAMIDLRAETNALLFTYRHHRYFHLSGASDAPALISRRRFGRRSVPARYRCPLRRPRSAGSARARGERAMDVVSPSRPRT